MNTLIKTISILIVVILVSIIFSKKDISATDKTGCEAFLYISNNSLFEITLFIDGFDAGYLLVGKSKIYKVELLNDTPKKIKTKVSWIHPDYIEPKSMNFLTKGKMECGQTDTLYIAFTK
jgi:hypothetical protein